MPDASHDIAVLNSLIATTIDSVNGYTEAAENSESRFSALFTSRAGERQQVAARLQQQVAALGGAPEDGGTLLAGAHRAFLKLKAAVTGQNEKAIIDEVEAGEDHIKAKFEDAVRDSGLSPSVRTAIEEAYSSVKEGHDEMRDLKHSLER
ncbi:PA2169 family four-helix-bundle protein [Sphingomonas crocodyli]|uniref:PA2169 family four-helix-bundle protein n=1 Tax=Sphingomonas crocodyli TaxID=1979270 RepID=A0A437LYP7_9SPHN|nr:PA2169 family four-helix-bundle protein [Sphingomonas crocodyli]RVT90443.1 PA2169 family four-helix-bundle protein [Sphingomonas crocodyli]